MRGVYEYTYRIAAVTTARTLMYYTAPSTAIAEILGALVSNESNETNEQIVCCIQKVTTLGTPTATTVTGAKTEQGSSAAGGTCKANVTASEPTYPALAQGADVIDTFGMEGVASLGGWRYDPIPETRGYIAPGATYGIRLLVAITAADLVVRYLIREIG